MTTPDVTQSPANPVALDVGVNQDHGDGHRRGRNHGGLHREGDARRAGSFGRTRTLGALSLSDGATLSPAFDPAMLKYTASVGNGC